ncbi:MAG: penicillin-binding protein 2, partial [Spirochaetaceae bacterium]|nr:penicillin-binding protein 2 [Spirochaetaceae bacterium]
MRPTDLKGVPGSSASKNVKILILTAVIFSIMAVYALRLFSMQITEGADYRRRSVSISQRSKRIPAQRGEIYDRHGNLPMVINTDSFAVDIIPGEIPSGRYDTVASKLAGYLGISKAAVDRVIPPSVRRSYTTIEIKSNITFETIMQIAENKADLPGVSWRSKPIRNYVETGSISHVVGYVGDITKEELKVRYNRGYTSSSVIGKAGIESQYDELLQGVEGSESRTVDAQGKYMAESPVIKTPVMGKNLVLTIDRDIQQLAEKALGNRVGAAVVMQPATGEVLAMVSYPYYDPNIFSRETMGAEYARLLNDPNNPLLNRVVNASYPPASTFKIVMSTAIYAENAIPPDKTFECAGEISYGNRLFRCHIRK